MSDELSNVLKSDAFWLRLLSAAAMIGTMPTFSNATSLPQSEAKRCADSAQTLLNAIKQREAEKE